MTVDPAVLAARLEGARSLNAAVAWSPEALAAECARVPADGPLGGMPVAVKDNIVTAELPTTCASRILAGYRSPFTATAVTRLRAAGGRVACTANMDEFAMGSSTEHSAYGRVLHPLDPARVPGGSSGGSAALVAAGVVPAALGSETGGSVRQPAAFCGVVGVKPSYGRVSRFGLVAFGSSLDCIGVFGATVDDAARVLTAIAGPDGRDATTVAAPPLTLAPKLDSLAGLTFGLPREYFPADLDPGIRAGVDRAVAVVRDLGGRVVDVSLPHARFAVPTYYVLAPAEAAANLARYDGVRYGNRQIGAAGDLRSLYQATRGRGFGPEVRRRILVGTYVLSAGYYDAYYGRAQSARSLIAADFRAVFASGVDALLTPTTPTPAFKAGDKLADPVQMYLADVFVCSANLAGLPAMSLPVGRSEGLPVGLQIMSPWLDEARMLAVAGALERAIDPVAEVVR
ncbi:MAG: Asp-tRNA(Asn)/Glu-tRNA(Gln) amidotransferase subunit GatA [Gemmatimonadales bacterium]|nr:Asp-tRNA(Asn)/Glu-tRNA(Gln) amidotransferase subunit GatA [Gemmatimonadales bacterium]